MDDKEMTMREALNRATNDGLVRQSDLRGFYAAPVSAQDLVELTKARCLLAEVCLRESILNGDAAWEEAIVVAHHRLSRARLGPPLRPLREFRFNDQLVWGLIVGLTIILLPTLKSLHGAGKNLLVFFGALYAVRGFGVLTWFMAPGSLGVTLTVSFVLLFAPILGAFAALALLMLAVAALALGLGDTWADWRSRARPTS